MEPENEIARLEQLSPGQLASFIDELIGKDFPRLVQMLYRLDVSEAKLKTLLQENAGEQPGALIAALIIERIAQQKKSRELFKRNEDIPEDEKW